MEDKNRQGNNNACFALVVTTDATEEGKIEGRIRFDDFTGSGDGA